MFIKENRMSFFLDQKIMKVLLFNFLKIKKNFFFRKTVRVSITFWMLPKNSTEIFSSFVVGYRFRQLRDSKRAVKSGLLSEQTPTLNGIN